jgi:uncharacterized membrane protein YfcA
VTALHAVVILLAGAGAGAINAVVGSGTLITFPTLLALGYAPVPANVSNNIGLVFGNVTGTWGYRRELAGQRGTLVRLGPMSLAGGVVGALALVSRPDAFGTVVPALIALSVVLVLLQPRIARAVAARRAATAQGRQETTGSHAGPVVMAGVALAGVYGGYFGAAQGVMLIGLLGALLAESLQRVNAAKNLLTTIVNGVAAVTFLVVARDQVDGWVVLLVAAGSFVGGLVGARVGRRLPPAALRAIIVVVGVVAVVRLVSP